MAVRQDAIEQYKKALKMGQKYYNAAVVRGEYPYPQVLSEVFSEFMSVGHEKIGLTDIPADKIVGTTTAGRKSAFAGNFMPLLGANTEFAKKWVNLCEAHLGETGIRDPIVCYEYMGRFYVTEGNKRVSVLKSYDAVTIPAIVTRILPVRSDDPEVQIYYEFLDFYKVSGLYGIKFSKKGSYALFLSLLGFAPDHVWTKEERSEVFGAFVHFKNVFMRMGGDRLKPRTADALLQWLQIYPKEDLWDEARIAETLETIWPDLRLESEDDPIEVSTEPEEADRSVLSQLFGFGRIAHLNIAFIYAFPSEKSGWTAAHDQGRKELEEKLGSRVTVKTYVTDMEDAQDVMEQAVTEGAQVLIATVPPLVSASRAVAARHPGLRVLNCSLSMPYAGLRTYYGRIYEAKFIAGAIAGAMTTEDRIGYVASYPILGVPASINAFALGARLTNPRAVVSLKWSCVAGNPVQELVNEGVTVISNKESGSVSPYAAWEWGTYFIDHADRELVPLASPCWNWGKFYEQVIESILSGGWEENGEIDRAVNYWWGMNSDVIDVELSPTLPEGLKQLAEILKRGIVEGTLDPFLTGITDQSGEIRSDGSRIFTPEEIMDMDWLCDNVEGSIPAYSELLPASRQLVRLLGIDKDEIPMEKEDLLL